MIYVLARLRLRPTRHVAAHTKFDTFASSLATQAELVSQRRALTSGPAAMAFSSFGSDQKNRRSDDLAAPPDTGWRQKSAQITFSCAQMIGRTYLGCAGKYRFVRPLGAGETEEKVLDDRVGPNRTGQAADCRTAGAARCRTGKAQR